MLAYSLNALFSGAEVSIIAANYRRENTFTLNTFVSGAQVAIVTDNSSKKTFTIIAGVISA